MLQMAPVRAAFLLGFLTLVLVACGGQDNAPPVAVAGGSVQATLGQEVQLDGSDSTDPNDDPLTFAWAFTLRPDGSTAVLEKANTATSSFTSDLAGDYELELTVSDGQAEDSDLIRITVQSNDTEAANNAPTAKAGGDQAVVLGKTVKLDGGSSTDPDGDSLTFNWSFTLRPDGSAAALEGANTATPGFSPDKVGAYELKLTVSDGQATDSDLLRVTVASNPPQADAGDGQTVKLGNKVQLDGTGSTDPEGDPLSFVWSFVSRPVGSSASLQDSDTAHPFFVPDLVGNYELELSISDGTTKDSDTVLITVASADDGTPNNPPTADAGADQIVPVGDTVELDGQASSDPDGDLLSFSWTFVSKPASSGATLDDPSSRTPRFTADVAGVYELELTVSDGEASASDTVTIEANQPPQAKAGADQEIRLGDTATLSGSASSDPDGDSLSYSWAFINPPAGSTATLHNADKASASFEPDVEGYYIVELTVSDGVTEASDRVTVMAIPASGTVSSVLFVSPSGDDSNPGTESEPLKTLQAALNKVSSNPDIRRIRFTPGIYNSEPFDYDINMDLQLVGPEDPSTPAVLSATGDLLSVPGGFFSSAFVTITRLTLKSNATAVYVGDGSGVSLVDVICEAKSCVESGVFFGESGGRVTITDSKFFGDGTGSGVSAFDADSVVITNSSIDGFNTGVSIWATPLVLREHSSLNNNDTGLSILEGDNTLVSGSTFNGNDVGILTLGARNVTVQSTDIIGSTTTGVQVEGDSGVFLKAGTNISEEGDADGVGLMINRDSKSSGAVVTLRDTTIDVWPGYGIIVSGKESILDLGSSSVPGNNDVQGGLFAALLDERDSGATGLITLNNTKLNNVYPPAKTYAGPGFLKYGMLIENANEVIVY